MRRSLWLKTYISVLLSAWLLVVGAVAYGMRWPFLKVLTAKESFMVIAILAVIVAGILGVCSLAIRAFQRFHKT